MIRPLYLIFLLTILNRTVSLGQYECSLLADYCKTDPDCSDDKVFYRNCLNRHVIIEKKRSTEEGLPPHVWYPQDSSVQKYSSYNPNLFYKRTVLIPQRAGLYQAEGLQHSEDLVNLRINTYIQPTQVFSREQKIKELRNIYKSYRRESLRESLDIIRSRLNNLKENHDVKQENTFFPVQKEPLLQLTKRGQETGDQTLSSYNSHVEDNISSDEDKKKSIILNDAFHLIQDLINQKSESAKKSIIDKQIISSTAYFHKHSDNKQIVDQKPINSKDIPTVLANPIPSENQVTDREEVAIPTFTHSETRKESPDTEDKGFLIINTPNSLTKKRAITLAEKLQELLWNIKPSDHRIFTLDGLLKNSVKYHMVTQPSWFGSVDDAESTAEKLNTDSKLKNQVTNTTGVFVLSASSSQPVGALPIAVKKPKSLDKLTLFTAIIGGCILVLILTTLIVCSIRRRGNNSPVAFKKQEAVQDYQELCRTQMSVVNSPRPEDETDKDGAMRSWNDDPFPYNMDITTGHVILAYMEDHLKNENRLNKEWEALCSYKADDNETNVGSDPKNTTKNRYRDVLPYDQTRVKLRETSNIFHSDYINGSFITDVDPRNPDYIATQGPLDNTVADFWQMVWEQGIVVIVNLTKLSDMGLPQCHRYWPEDGSEIYHIYEVHLISEHIWCDDYLVRSLYLKNLQTAETRTITQFHYLSWPDLSIPSSTKPLLEFRRKVNKCYRGHANPIIVHCNNGVGRTGTYILLDMVLNKMIKGTKEIDIAATLEHIRDQRPDMVKTKGQFEFALTGVAEEVTSILSAVPR